MENLDAFNCLSNTSGFDKVKKKIANNEKQKQDYINQLVIAKMLSHLENLEIKCMECSHDIVFEYKNKTYSAEVKTIYFTQRQKILNNPPFTRKVDINHLPEEEALINEIPSEFSTLKTIIDKIGEAYKQLKLNKDCLNIVFLLTDAWGTHHSNFDDATYEMFHSRFQGEKPPKWEKLQAVVFYSDRFKNYLYENPNALIKMDEELKNSIQQAKF